MLFSFNFKDVRMKVKEFKRLIANVADDKDFIIDNRLDIDFAIYIVKGDDLRIVIEKKTCENCIHSNNEDDYCLNCIGKLGWELRK